jgi:hypothetical protein
MITEIATGFVEVGLSFAKVLSGDSVIAATIT